MRLLIALGGNALLQRGEPLTAFSQIANIRRATAQIAPLADRHQLLITHGNGPQVGLLALQAAANAPGENTTKGRPLPASPPMPLDILGAESAGMIGYLLEQELANVLSAERVVTTVLTRVVVDVNDPAFEHPTKPIGPFYSKIKAERLAAWHHWSMTATEGTGYRRYRRVVASPKPQRLVDSKPILWLLERNAIVVAAGGGGIPVVVSADGKTYSGVDAVIDKDLSSALLAKDAAVDLLIIATDVDAVYTNWGTAGAQPLREVPAEQLRTMRFSAGSMGPKVEAVCQFVEQTGNPAVIGSLQQIEAMVDGCAGTRVIPAQAC
jgi:carbamate kinase